MTQAALILVRGLGSMNGKMPWDRSVPPPYGEDLCRRVDTPVHRFSLIESSIGLPLQVVTGSRQVGRTTLVTQVTG